MDPILKDKSVLVTGATGGLGRAVAQAFVSAGARLYGAARKWKVEDVPSGGFTTIQADVTRAEDCRAALTRIVSETRRIDAVVHLVGGFSGGKRIEETGDDLWDNMMNLNLRSAFVLFREALPPMRSAGHGRLIAVGSRAGVDPAPSIAAYGVSKAALHALIRHIAAETKDTGVTANAVLPSVIDTDANRAAMPQADFSKWVTPASIAALLVWLVSDQSRDVSGALIPVYGGA